MDITALILNCTLKKSPEPSNTQALIDIVTGHFDELGVRHETLRPVDYDIPFGIVSDMGEGDEWPQILEKLLAADILILGMSIWFGVRSSVCQMVIERLDGTYNTTNEAKVKKGTLTGTQINASTLGMVPSAVHSTSADTANSINAPEPFHEVGTPGEPQFQNGCSNIGGADSTVAFLKDREGFVHLKGQYVCGAAGKVAFQLPAGYRPASGTSELFPQSGSSAGSVNVWIAGTGFAQGGQVEGGVVCLLQTACFLDGITFLAES